MLLKLESGTHFKISEDKVVIENQTRRLVLKGLSLHLAECMQRMVVGAKESALEELAANELPFFYHLLEKLKGFLNYSVEGLATLQPLKETFEFREYLLKGKCFFLSRFSLIRMSEGKMVMETPLAPACLYIEDEKVLHLLYALSTPKTLEELLSTFPTFQTEQIENLLLLLLNGKFLEEKEESALALWEFHDLLFHSRIRMGRHANPYGGLYPFKGKIEPLPPHKPPYSTQKIPLPTPDLKAIKQNDPSFTEVLERRKSHRRKGVKQLNINEISEFLYRSAKSQEGKRSYPGGGGLYEHELYLVVHACEGLAAGAYHYHSAEHALYPLEASIESCRVLLEDAMFSTNKEELPSLLVVLGARFGRISWKYRSIAYGTILKNTGVLMHQMYLVATAMNLAPCAVGGGNADHFATLIGSNYYEESSVGEFILDAF